MTNERVSAEQQQLGCLNMFTLVSRDTRDSLVTPSVTLPHTSHRVTTYNATRRSIFPIFKCPLVSRDMLLHITQSVIGHAYQHLCHLCHIYHMHNLHFDQTLDDLTFSERWYV